MPYSVSICTASHWRKWRERALEIGVGELEVTAEDGWHQILRDGARQLLANCQYSCWKQQHPSTCLSSIPWDAVPKPIPAGSLPLSEQFAFFWDRCTVPLLLRTPLLSGLCAGSVHNPEWSLVTLGKDIWPMLVRGQCTLWRNAGYLNNVSRPCWKVLTVMGPGRADPSHGKIDRHLSLARLSQPVSLNGHMEIQVIQSQSCKVYRSFSQGKGLTS